MKVKMIFISLLISGMIAGCKEDNVRAPYGIEDTTPPQEVTNITVKNTAEERSSNTISRLIPT